MGQRLIALGHEESHLEIAAAIERTTHPRLGEDAGQVAGIGQLGLPLTATWPSEVDALVDFSLPDAADQVLHKCATGGIPVVMATTGLSEATQALIQESAKRIPIVWAPSMSLAVNLTMKLAQLTAESLKDYPSGTDVEIIERHHRFKEDAPSGTALKFGHLIAHAMGAKQHVHGREGRPGVRPRDEIAYHALRVGDNPGEHTIVFGLLGETIELSVKASNRDCYARGALAAARYVAQCDPGLYSMCDVLGL